MFINVSNHKSSGWGQRQREAAEIYGEIVDIPFPPISSDYTSEEIDELVAQYLKKIQKYDDPVAMVQGEFVFTYRLVSELKAAGILALAGCTDRKVFEEKQPDGTVKKTSVFEFTRFREY